MRIRLTVMLALALASVAARNADEQGFADQFDVKRENLTNAGRSNFVILEPGYQHEYGSADKSARLVITVLDDTRKIDGVTTRVVEEREWHGEKLVEVSRNYFAIDRTTGDIYYFGEDVDEYKDGKVASHGGSWHAGEKGARFGLFMPATPKPGQKFFQEIAPKFAMDRVEIASVNEHVEVPAGKFEKCVKTNETTPLSPDELEHKLYAAGVGLVSDGEMRLVRHGPRGK